jgi:hypothetical protein
MGRTSTTDSSTRAAHLRGYGVWGVWVCMGVCVGVCGCVYGCVFVCGCMG